MRALYDVMVYRDDRLKEHSCRIERTMACQDIVDYLHNELGITDIHLSQSIANRAIDAAIEERGVAKIAGQFLNVLVTVQITRGDL